MKLRHKDKIMSWGMLIPCTIYLGGAVVHLAVSGKDAFPNVIFWISMAALFFMADRLDKQRKREQIVTDLLGELVAENNQLRRSLPESPQKAG